MAQTRKTTVHLTAKGVLEINKQGWRVWVSLHNTNGRLQRYDMPFKLEQVVIDNGDGEYEVEYDPTPVATCEYPDLLSVRFVEVLDVATKRCDLWARVR